MEKDYSEMTEQELENERQMIDCEIDKQKDELLDLEIKKAEQEFFCKQHNLPNFTYDECFSCGKKIFQYLTHEQCKNEHITGCPNCCRSFCD